MALWGSKGQGQSHPPLQEESLIELSTHPFRWVIPLQGSRQHLYSQHCNGSRSRAPRVLGKESVTETNTLIASSVQDRAQQPAILLHPNSETLIILPLPGWLRPAASICELPGEQGRYCEENFSFMHCPF